MWLILYQSCGNCFLVPGDFVDYLGLNVKFCYLWGKTVLYFSMSLISFPCLIVLARTSSTVLKRNGQRLYSCLAPDLSRKTSSFSLINMMIVVRFL